MSSIFKHSMAGLGMALFLAACGGGGDGGSAAPSVSISADKTLVEVGQTVKLTSSTDAGGSPAYAWKLRSFPPASKAVLATTDQPGSAITPDRVGDYVVGLNITDGQRGAEAQVTVTAFSKEPTANAGEDIATLPGPVQLDGSGSQPPYQGDPTRLMYSWVLVTVPEGSTASIDDATQVQPRFTADKTGDYKAALTVRYGDMVSAVDEVDIKVVAANVPPVAVISQDGQSVNGKTLMVVRGQPVTLSAELSTDPDHPGETGHLQYRWDFQGNGNSNGLPIGSEAFMQGERTVTMTFTPDVAATYYVTLYVYDGVTRSSTMLGLRAQPPEGAENMPPVLASPLPPSGNNTYEIERSNQKVIFTSDRAAFDPDGDSYVYEWTWVSYPSGFDPVADSTLSTSYWDSGFIPKVDGDYVIEARLKDSKGAYSNTVRQTYTVMLGANHAPRAEASSATGNTNFMVGEKASLSGSNSSDVDGNRLVFRWELLDRPDGSEAAFDNTKVERPLLMLDKPGYYTARLTVTDEWGFPNYYANNRPNYITIKAKSENHAPVVRPTLDQPYTAEQPLVLGVRERRKYTSGVTNVTEDVVVYNSFSVDANAYDPDGDTMTYLWNLTGEPSGHQFAFASDAACQNGRTASDASLAAAGKTLMQYWAEILEARSWSCAKQTLAPTMPGNYLMEALVYDGSITVGPYTLSVPAVDRANFPTLLLEQLKTPESADETELSQRALPNKQQNYVNRYSFSGSFNPDVSYYRLTAFDKDYKIENLKAVSDAADFSAIFEGLENGQIIRKGESVVFRLQLQRDNPNAEMIFNATLLWSFEIAGRPDWNFSYTGWLTYM
ncbi:PKD domain-containing protein [Kerstersia gyiorum]|uniref:PKD domain-containing protein n=1 Tax=Kerstersia gyiorum TaxID=206506 RepID=UPI001070E0A0|nr:PKD domain-containing protein [Kerstersia gyiorum]QBR41545.1 PKD domain-containing protein [Kerstersia gyiorum]